MSVESLRSTLDDASRSIAGAMHGLEHDAIAQLNAEVAKLYAQLDRAPDLIKVAGDADLDLDPAPRWPMYVFLAGAIACLGMSTACHTLANVTERVSSIVWRLDYVGIAGLIVAKNFRERGATNSPSTNRPYLSRSSTCSVDCGAAS